MGRFLEVMLETRYPTTDFEVVCVAITAINSHVILPIARDCAKRDGDMWIIYMGNNEMVGPFGAGTIFGDKAPSRCVVKGTLVVRSSRIGQLLMAGLEKFREDEGVPDAWGGLEMFTGNTLRPDDPGRLKAYQNFKGNLDEIVRTGLDAGVPVLLSTVATNLRDCSPFISLHSTVSGFEATVWEERFNQGLELENRGDYDAALHIYSEAAATNPGHAELHYRMGRCHLALGDTSMALTAFKQAQANDALVIRADSRINTIIRQSIAELQGEGLIGLDSSALLARQSEDGIPGRETFYEHVHLTVDGNFRLARLMADKVAEVLPQGISTSTISNNVEAEFRVCADRLAFTRWDQKRVWDVALERISVTPFTAQSSQPATVEYFRQQMSRVDDQGNRYPVQRAYEFALRINPDDTMVRWNYAQFLERTGRIPEAITQGQEVCRRLPHAAWPHYFVGSLMAKEGRTEEAVPFLHAAIEINPTSKFARLELDRIAGQ
jgi:tetratricopeptide (TPR) repeat protein